MKRFALSLLMISCLLSGQASVLNPFLMMEVDTAEYVSPMDTTVYIPPVDTTHYEPVDTTYYEPVDTTYYEPVDTGEVVTPIVPDKPVIHVPTIREEDNVTEFLHNPVVDDSSSDKLSKQEFAMAIEGDYLRIKGTLMARGYGKHYIHCQIIGDSVHLQRFDMDPESTDMILHNVDIRIPGFTEDYYHVTLAEQNDVPLYKQYMMMSRAVARNIDYSATTEFSVTGTTWYANYHYENFLFGNSDYENKEIAYTLGTDTLIDGQTWKKFYENNTYRGAFREQDGKVWFYPNKEDLNYYGFEDGVPTLMYDFTLQVGDIIYNRENFSPGFTHEKPENADDFLGHWEVVNVRYEHGRKVIDLDCQGWGTEQWIEGIGSVRYAFFDYWSPRVNNGSSSWETIYQVVSEGKTIYFNGELANPEANPWMQKGMTWTQNWNYNGHSEGKFREVTLTEEVRPGTFTFDMPNEEAWFLFEHLQDFNGKVYAIGNGRIELCYDFTVQEGDEIALLKYYFHDGRSRPIFTYDTCTVSEVSSIELDGISRKQITLKGDREDVWVEGIGSLSRVCPIDGMSVYSSIQFAQSRITCLCKEGETLYLHPDFIDCTTSRTSGISPSAVGDLTIYAIGQSLHCVSPSAVKLEIYTMDAVKVGQSSFHNGAAMVTIPKTPATYLYIVTHPDGKRESGKVGIQ